MQKGSHGAVSVHSVYSVLFGVFGVFGGKAVRCAACITSYGASTAFETTGRAFDRSAFVATEAVIR